MLFLEDALTITVVVSPKNNEDIFGQRYEDKGVEYDRHDPQYVVFVINSIRESTCKHIEGRCPYVSIHHSNALEC